MSLQLGALHEGLATLGTHVDTRTVRVKMLAHGSIVAKHLVASLDGRPREDGRRQVKNNVIPQTGREILQ